MNAVSLFSLVADADPLDVDEVPVAHAYELLVHRLRETPEPRRVGSGRIRVLVVAAAIIVAIGAAIAAADGINPFLGISAVNHLRSSDDQLSPEVLNMIDSFNAQDLSSSIGQLLPDSSRLVGEVADGQRYYAVATSGGGLCVVVEQQHSAAVNCGQPLTQSRPTTVGRVTEVVTGPNATPPVTFGVARDDVDSVSFRTGTKITSVPVRHNVWAYQGDSSATQSLTVHYSDGTSQTLSAPSPSDAATHQP